jgi:hypothetical protein
MPLPPSPRDILAYERVVLDSASTRQVAAELEISQTRVRQIVGRVGIWLAEQLPQADEVKDAAQIRLAQHIAADRLYRYLADADEAWHKTRESKYMTTIIRLLTAVTKLPAQPHTLAALTADALDKVVPSRREGYESELALQSEPPSPTNNDSASPPSVSPSLNPSVLSPPSPPLRACSPTPTSPPPSTPLSSPAITLNSPPPTTSANLPADKHAARAAFLAPAHLPEINDHSSIAELEITPQKLGFRTTSKPLNRRQRRRLERLATTKS